MVSVCILNWNNLETLKKIIPKLQSLNVGYEIIIYDQNSTDGSIEYLNTLLHIDNISVYFSSYNTGNSISRNYMIGIAKYEYVLLLDSDIIPIDNSIESMIRFMKEHGDYLYIGYDHNTWSTDISSVTNYEYGISEDELTNSDNMVLAHYGIFKKSVLIDYPFPEFYPFNCEGWGAEDDIVGMTITQNEIGKTGKILNRVYFHNKGSSIPHVGNDSNRLYILRYLYFKYFQVFLSGIDKKESLTNRKIKTTQLNLKQYGCNHGVNLNSVVANYIFKEIFPFFKFNQTSDNLFIFGGRLLDNIPINEHNYFKKFENIEIFGTTVGDVFDINIELMDRLNIYPITNSAKNLLEDNNMKNVNNPVGDVFQLFCLLPNLEFNPIFGENAEDDLMYFSKTGLWKDTQSNLIYFIDTLYRMLSKYKSTPKLKILYIAGHLSTGGMPEVLRARIESLSSLNVEVWVVEYSLYSIQYTTQRDAIQRMLGDRFISLGWFSQDDNITYNKYLKIKDLIDKQNFDIIHIEGCIETYDYFNKPHVQLLEFLYENPNKTWKLVETIHISSFNANQHKRWIPDAFMHCSEYNYTDTFSKFNSVIPTTVIEYPIWERDYKFEKPDGFDIDKFNIINVGIWTPGKNQKEAVEMARYLDEIEPNKYIFHFIGALAPNFESYWRPIISDLPKNVKIWDVQSEMGKFYQWADLVLFNSTFELNPIVLKEAVSFKKPLLMRNLEIYNGAYDKYASYLSGDLISDTLQLQSILHNPIVVDYEFSELKQMGTDMLKFYEQINGVGQTIKLTDNRTDAPISFSAQFLNGAFLEIIGDNDGTNYRVEFIDSATNQLKYSTNLLPHHWAKTSIQYYVDWDINIIPNNSKYKSINYKMDLSNKKVLIRFESSSLGDTIAWIPYVDEFRKKHNCIVYCSTFHNNLFIDEYPNINFVSPNENIFNLYAQYNIGWFYENGKFDVNSHKSNFITQPLQKTASDILGLDYREIRPLIKNYSYIGDLPKRYFTFSLQSTAQSKYWNYTNGWYSLLELLRGAGLVGVCVDKYKQFGIENSMNYMPSNAIDKTGLSLEDTIGVINGAEFHIGLSSGVSWLAWAVGKQVVMISGFTNPDLEFNQNCIRIHNDTVCNGCFSNPNYTFDKSDWMWCPVHKGTDGQFECTKTITPAMVYSSIKSKNLL